MKFIKYIHALFAVLLLLVSVIAQAGITPEQASQIAGIAVAMTQQIDGYHLDYSPGSLKVVDKILLKLHDEGNSPDSIPKTVLTYGCYVGEVMVRNLGYKWDEPTEKEKSVGFEIIGIRDKEGGFSNPIGKVYKRVKNGEEDSVTFFYEAYSKGIANYIEKANSGK